MAGEPKYRQELPAEVVAALDQYVERIKAIRWFKPDANIKRDNVETAVKAAISAFGVEASIEYRQLKTPADWGAAREAARDAAWEAARGAAWGAARDAAWEAARGAAWDAAWDAAWGAAREAARDAAWEAARGAAWGAADVLATFTPSYKCKTPFVRLVDIYEMGLLPIGVVKGKFIVYVPPCKLDFPEDLK